MQFVAPRGPQGREVLGAASPQRKSVLAPMSPAAGSAALGGGQMGEVTAGLHAEGNDPSLALGRLQRGFPTPRLSPLATPGESLPLSGLCS